MLGRQNVLLLCCAAVAITAYAPDVMAVTISTAFSGQVQSSDFSPAKYVSGNFRVSFDNSASIIGIPDAFHLKWDGIDYSPANTTFREQPFSGETIISILSPGGFQFGTSGFELAVFPQQNRIRFDGTVSGNPRYYSSLVTAQNPFVGAVTTTNINLANNLPPPVTQPLFPGLSFLAPSNVVNGIGVWINGNISKFDPSLESYLYQVSINPALKADAKAAADVWEKYNLLSSIVDPLQAAATGNYLSESIGLARFVGDRVVVDPAVADDVQRTFAITNFGIDLGTAVNGCRGGPAACLGVADSFIWNNLVLPQLKKFGDDPPDPNYQTVFKLPSTLPGFAFNTDDTAFNGLATPTFSDLEGAGAYLYAANIALDRYGAALGAGDSVSAMNQLNAFLYYTELYQKTMAAYAHERSQLLSSQSIQANPDEELKLDALLAFQDRLRQFGFSADELAILDSLGVSDSDKSTFLAMLIGLDPTIEPGTTRGTVASALNDNAFLAAGASPVPEPSTLSLFGVGAALICFALRRKRPANAAP